MSYNFTASGFAADSLPFAFFASHCAVRNGVDELFLVGSSDQSVKAKCLMDSSLLDLRVAQNYVGNATFSHSEHSLSFDAFKFDQSSSLNLECDIEICLTDDCPAYSAPRGGNCLPSEWADWAGWTQCDVTCGNGTRSRDRNCENGDPGDFGCYGEQNQTESCNTSPCRE